MEEEHQAEIVEEPTPEQVASQQRVVDELLNQVNRARAEVEQIIGKKIGVEEHTGPVTSGGSMPFQSSAFEHFAGDIKKALPAMKSQAQLKAFAIGFEALRLVANSIFAGDALNEAGGRQALDKAFEAMKQATTLTNKLEDVPEAAEGGIASELKTPPVSEETLLSTLLDELDHITTYSDLIQWYQQNRSRFERIMSSTRRNQLFDTIGLKKAQLKT